MMSQGPLDPYGNELFCCSMVAAFGSGALFSLVSGVGGPNQAANAVTSGLFFALFQGGLYMVSIVLLQFHLVAVSLKFSCSASVTIALLCNGQCNFIAIPSFYFA